MYAQSEQRNFTKRTIRIAQHNESQKSLHRSNSNLAVLRRQLLAKERDKARHQSSAGGISGSRPAPHLLQ